MTRTIRGYIARRRRKKSRIFASNNRRAHSGLTRSIIQQTIIALTSSHRDKGQTKEKFSSLMDHSYKCNNSGDLGII